MRLKLLFLYYFVLSVLLNRIYVCVHKYLGLTLPIMMTVIKTILSLKSKYNYLDLTSNEMYVNTNLYTQLCAAYLFISFCNNRSDEFSTLCLYSKFTVFIMTMYVIDFSRYICYMIVLIHRDVMDMCRILPIVVSEYGVFLFRLCYTLPFFHYFLYLLFKFIQRFSFLFGLKEFSIGHISSHHPQDYYISILSSAHWDIVLQKKSCSRTIFHLIVWCWNHVMNKCAIQPYLNER